MKTHAYFERRKQSHGITEQQVEEALRHEIAREVQKDGRIRVWGYLEAIDKCVRVVLLEDAETLFNAFPDSNFTRKWRAQ